MTRRRALLAVASGAAALAGCTGREADPVTVRRRMGNRALENYEARQVRNEHGAALFARDRAVPTVAEGERGRYSRAGRSVVVSEDDFAEMTFGDNPEADRLREFAAGTDFDSASLYLLAMSIESCYEIRLQSVTVEWDVDGEREQTELAVDAFGRETAGSVSLSSGEDVTLAVARDGRVSRNEYSI